MSREKAFLEKTSRKPEKHKRQVNEVNEDSRFEKISFKKYLREIEEEQMLDNESDFSHEELVHLAEDFIESNKYNGKPDIDTLREDAMSHFKLMGLYGDQLEEAFELLTGLIDEEYE